MLDESWLGRKFDGPRFARRKGAAGRVLYLDLFCIGTQPSTNTDPYLFVRSVLDPVCLLDRFKTHLISTLTLPNPANTSK